MLNMRGASPVGRDGGSRLYAARTVSRRWPSKCRREPMSESDGKYSRAVKGASDWVPVGNG